MFSLTKSSNTPEKKNFESSLYQRLIEKKNATPFVIFSSICGFVGGMDS
jgi:hypothetical protein